MAGTQIYRWKTGTTMAFAHARTSTHGTETRASLQKIDKTMLLYRSLESVPNSQIILSLGCERSSIPLPRNSGISMSSYQSRQPAIVLLSGHLNRFLLLRRGRNRLDLCMWNMAFSSVKPPEIGLMSRTSISARFRW